MLTKESFYDLEFFFFFHLVVHVVVKNVSGLISFSSVLNFLLVAVKKVHAVAIPGVVAAECGITRGVFTAWKEPCCIHKQALVYLFLTKVFIMNI